MAKEGATQGIIGTGSGSPFESQSHVYICEGPRDTAKLQVNIFPTAGVSASVSYFWQYRVDDETTWKMKGSKSSFSKTQWNNAVSDNSPLFAYRNFRFNLGDMERATYFRLALVCENDTLYSNEIQIDARFRAQISGPVGAQVEGLGYKTCQLKGDYPHYYFDTISFSVTPADTILLLPLRSESECSIPISSSIITDSKGNPCITDIWYSCINKPSVERHSVKLYVDGGIYANFDKVFCGYTPLECNYSLIATAIPDVAWKDRATGKSYSGWRLMEMCIVEDMEFDAVSVEKYNLYIKGSQVTSLTCADILGDGKVSYDPATKTLYLTDANISGAYSSTPAVVAVYDDITIHCAGTTNVIANYSDNEYAAISEDAGHVTITGNAELAMFISTGSVLDLQNGLTIKDGCSVVAIRTKVMPYATINLGGGVLTVDGANLQAEGSKNAPTIANCGGLVLNNAAITSGHTYDATTHKFLDADGNEATDGIMIKSTATGLEQLTIDDAQCTMHNAKFLHKGQLLIRRGNKLYNAVGTEL